jgi:hypothetical protein
MLTIDNNYRYHTISTLPTTTQSYIPHQNLYTSQSKSTDTSTIIETDPLIQQELKFKQIKYQQQKEKIKSLKRQLQMANDNSDITTLKTNIYDDLSGISLQLTRQNEQIKHIISENTELRNMLTNKNNLISQYQEVIRTSTYKIKEMEQIIHNMKEDLKDKSHLIQTNDRLKEDNDILYRNIQEIKSQLNQIEIVYEQKMVCKNNVIEELNKEISYVKERNESIQKTAQNVSYSDQYEKDQLQWQINCLLKEKEILMQEKERDHKEIIQYRNMFDNGKNYCCVINNDNNNIYNDEMVKLIKMKENEFMKEITNLRQMVVEREKEIDYIKEQFLGIIHDLKIENEKLRNNLVQLANQQYKQQINKLY